MTVRERRLKVTYGNLAYKYDYVQDKVPKNQEKVERKAKPKTNTGNKNKISYTQKLLSVIILAASAIFMIIQFVEVNETVSELETVRSEYKFQESVTSQKTYELEQSIDLSKIEQEATTRLGMKRPEKYQQVYIDVKKDDVTEKVSGEVEGIENRFIKMINTIIDHIVTMFSI